MKIFLNSLVTICFAISTSAFAFNYRVECPPAGIINIGASFLDTVTMVMEPSFIRYDVYIKNRLIKVENRDWAVGVMVQSDKLKDFDYAFKTAQTELSTENYSLKERYALNVNNAYYCTYYRVGDNVKFAYAYTIDNKAMSYRQLMQKLSA